MALSLQSANLVRQKTRMYNLSPVAFHTLKGFFQWWATHKGNENLQLIPFSDSSSATDGICQNTGYSPIGAVTSTVYVLYAKNAGDGDGTDAYIRLYNETANTTNTNAFVTGLISDDDNEFIMVNPNGWVFATDLTISSDTGTDATESTAGNSADGFVIVGA